MSRTHYATSMPFSTALNYKPKRKGPIPSTFGEYKPGIGFTITRENIEAYQAQLAEMDKPRASAEQIVVAFGTDTDRQSNAKRYRETKDFKRRLARVESLILGTLKKANKK